jgi:hypothetical protein
MNMCHSRTTTPNSAPRCTAPCCTALQLSMHSTGMLAARGPSNRRHRPVCRRRSLYLPDPARGEGFGCPAGVPTVVPASTRCSCRALQGLASPRRRGLVLSPDCVGLHDPMDRSSPFSPLQAVMQTFLLHSAGGHLSPSGKPVINAQYQLQPIRQVPGCCPVCSVLSVWRLCEGFLGCPR